MLSYQFHFYLEIINQAHQQLQADNPHLSRYDTYVFLMNQGVIASNGRPKKAAIESGALEVFCEDPDISFEEFLMVYPVFKRYSPHLFYLINHFWEIDHRLWKQIHLDRQMNLFSQDEVNQLDRYFVDRKLSKEN